MIELFGVICDRFVELLIVGCYGTSLGVAYQNSIVAKAVLILHPRDDFQTSAFPGIVFGIIAFGTVFLQLIFRLNVYFHVCNDSRNLLSLKSVILIFLTFFILLMSINASPQLFIIVLDIIYVLDHFALPLIIIYDNEDAKKYFKLHNPKLMNMIQVVIQFLQLSKNEIMQFIWFLKNKICGSSSDQVAPIEMIELQEVH